MSHRGASSERAPADRPAQRRVSRRSLLRAAGGAVPALLLACRRRDSPATPTATTASADETATVTPPPPRTPRPSPATPTAARPTTTVTPKPEEQVYYQGGYTRDPASHDFNADVTCGGEPSLWAGLLTLDPDLVPVADWAQAWEADANGSVWLFHLRPGNRGWSNGDPVTAHDFVWSWRRLLLPDTAAPHASILFDVKNAVQINQQGADPATLGVDALDDWTLRVELVGPRATFPAVAAAIGTVPAHRPSVEQHGAAWTEAGSCVSNGPFKLVAWEHDVRYETARNDGYWNAVAVRLSRCVTPIIPGDQQMTAYRENRIDRVAVPGSDLAGVRADGSLQAELHEAVAAATWLLLPQVTSPPFDEPRVRQALGHAVDRERLVQIAQGRARAALGLIPPGLPGSIQAGDTANLLTFDIDAALELLEGTPYAGGNNWPPVTLSMREADPDAELLAHDVAAQLAENLGMQVHVQVLEAREFDAALADRRLPLVWLRRWFSVADPRDGYEALFAAAPPAAPVVAWSSSALADLLDRARREINSGARLALYRQCEELLQQQAVYVPVVHPVQFSLVKPWIKDLPRNAAGQPPPAGSLYTRLTSDIRVSGRQPDAASG